MAPSKYIDFADALFPDNVPDSPLFRKHLRAIFALGFRPMQLIRHTIVVLSRKTRANAEPSHLPYEFADFANLLAPDSAAEFSMSAVSLWN